MTKMFFNSFLNLYNMQIKLDIFAIVNSNILIHALMKTTCVLLYFSQQSKQEK